MQASLYTILAGSVGVAETAEMGGAISSVDRWEPVETAFP